MVHVELTKYDGELIIVNFEQVRSFYEDKGDDSTGGTVLKFLDGNPFIGKRTFCRDL